MLKNRLSNKIAEYLKKSKINDKLEIGKDYRVDFLAQGEYNINFIIDNHTKKYVFRVNTDSQLNIDNQIKYEFDAIKALEVSGVTPKVYYLDDSKEYFDYGILIMEYLEGRPLKYEKDIIKAANIFGKIHSIDCDKKDFNNFIVEEKLFSDRVIEARKLVKNFMISSKVKLEVKKFFDKFLQWSETNKYKEKYFIDNKWHVINNTEVNSHNFIIGKKDYYLIDWEKPVISDPCQDITQFLAPTTTLWKANYILSSQEKNNFFNRYLESLDRKDKSIRERVNLYNPYLYLRALSWCAYAWLEYQDPNKDIKNLDTYKKIEQYLDIDFMSKLLKEYL